MFAPKKNDLIKSLCKLSANLCSYIKKPCDCKFINLNVNQNIATGSESGSGCPETLVVAMLLNHMTDQEFNSLCKKAGLLITEDNAPEINILQTVDKFQEERWTDKLKNVVLPVPKKKNRSSAYQPGKLPPNGLTEKSSPYQPRKIPKGFV